MADNLDLLLKEYRGLSLPDRRAIMDLLSVEERTLLRTKLRAATGRRQAQSATVQLDLSAYSSGLSRAITAALRSDTTPASARRAIYEAALAERSEV